MLNLNKCTWSVMHHILLSSVKMSAHLKINDSNESAGGAEGHKRFFNIKCQEKKQLLVVFTFYDLANVFS